MGNSKIIIKNTLLLYARMLLTMLVTLYTSRVILQILGVDDYGIYNIVGSIVVMCSFLSASMNSAFQRFISYEIGLREKGRLKEVYSMSITCVLMLSGIVFILLETVGLWFVLYRLNIPAERHYAALWVYQLSTITFLVNVISTTYNATIISYEKMTFYAYIGIIEVVFKLGIVYLLLITSFDKLIFYAFLLLIVTIIINIVKQQYCKKKFSLSYNPSIFDKYIFKRLTSFSGFSMLASSSVIVTQQGCNILLNLFYGVVVNAAYGIANQVCSAIYHFVTNFQVAFQPQIVKLYASNEITAQHRLMLQSSKFSYFLLLIIFVPFVTNVDYILHLWLGEVPKYTAEFCVCMLIYNLIDAVQAPLWIGINATGEIKIYTIWSSSLFILTLPLMYLVLHLGFNPFWALGVRVLVNFIAAVIRIFYVERLMKFSSINYVKMLIRYVLPVTFVSLIIPFFINRHIEVNFLTFSIETVLYVLFTFGIIYTIGLAKNERILIINMIKSKFFRQKI